MQRDLYEDVDGEKASGSNSPNPEESALLPGSVKMHRQANTLDHENVVVIRNNFKHADFVNFSSEIDFDLKYSDSAFIHKSNGMIIQSNASFSKQLNFGEPIHHDSGHQGKMVKIAMVSQVSLIELANYLEEGEFERARAHLFVRLSLPKSKVSYSAQLTSTPLQRFRRSSNLEVDHTVTLFEKKVLGITVKAVVRHWLQKGVRMGISAFLSIGSHNEPLFNKEYSWNELQNQQPTDDISQSWSTPSIVSVYRVLILASL